MVLNSLPFAIYFVFFFLIYWFVINRNLQLQNLLILAGSYLFYAWWDWRFLFLLIGSSLVTYILGFFISKNSNENKGKFLLTLGLVQGLGLLVLFKYYNFFTETFVEIFRIIGIEINIYSLTLILPLGISFYTFRTLSYLFDIYYGKIKPASNWVVYFSYVAFFPSLIAGPIDKPKALVPQLENKRVFDYSHAADGMRQLLWGLFKKTVIADNCAKLTGTIFDNYESLPASSLLLGAIYFTIQLYADFSGYSDMAIGFARLIGFNITKNFNYPFFAQNIAEYWRKWHISLTTWLTDYVFAPLTIAFRDYGKLGLIIAILVNFVLIGIWHGANWTFVLYGFLHGCYYIPLILRNTLNKKNKIDKDKPLPSFVEFKNMAVTFMLVVVTNIIFRSPNVATAFDYIGNLFSTSLLSYPVNAIPRGTEIILLPLILVLLIVEWLQRDKPHGLDIRTLTFPLRWSIYFVIFILYLYNAKEATDFMYFKF